jgi:hypothetical protein
MRISIARLAFYALCCALFWMATRDRLQAQTSISLPDIPGIPVKEAPFSAKLLIERKTLQANEATPPTISSASICRNGVGIMRTEKIIYDSAGVSVTIIQILDPNTRLSYTLDPKHRLAHRASLDQKPFGIAFTGNPALIADFNYGLSTEYWMRSIAGITVQHLGLGSYGDSVPVGEQDIAGFHVVGSQQTETLPKGKQDPDRISVTTWYSAVLRSTIVLKISDSREGERTMTLTNIQIGEPEPSLFQIPSNYKVVDEQGPFFLG